MGHLDADPCPAAASPSRGLPTCDLTHVTFWLPVLQPHSSSPLPRAGACLREGPPHPCLCSLPPGSAVQRLNFAFKGAGGRLGDR